MTDKILADIIVLIHFSFVLFAVFGSLLALKWRKIIWCHISAVLWAAYVMLTGVICPLTPLEMRLRQAAGQSSYEGGFIEHYILPVLYPESLTRELQIALGMAVFLLNLTTYLFFFYRWKRK